MEAVKNAIDKMAALMREKLLDRGLYIRVFDHVLKEAKAEVFAEVEQKEETEDGKMTSVMISVTLEEAERIAKWEQDFIPMASVPHFSKATHPTRVLVYAMKKGNESNPRAGKVLCDFYMYEFKERAGRKPRYDWVIMDVLPCKPPRELSEFGKVGFGNFVPLMRPPISWMYVEEKRNGND